MLISSMKAVGFSSNLKKWLSSETASYLET
jgi:hypothetical protein